MTPAPAPADFPFGGWLKAYRQQHGLNQKQLAEILRCSTSLVSHLEQGHRGLSADIGQLLLRHAHLPVEELPAYRAWSAGIGPRPVSALPAPPVDAGPPALAPRWSAVRSLPPRPRPLRRATHRTPQAAPLPAAVVPPAPVPAAPLPAAPVPPLFPHWRQHLAHRWALGVTACRQSLLLYPVDSAPARAAQRAIWGWIALVALESFLWASAPVPMMVVILACTLATMMVMEARPWIVYRLQQGQGLIDTIGGLTTCSICAIMIGGAFLSTVGEVIQQLM